MANGDMVRALAVKDAYSENTEHAQRTKRTLPAKSHSSLYQVHHLQLSTKNYMDTKIQTSKPNILKREQAFCNYQTEI